jgi:hypothetical protein
MMVMAAKIQQTYYARTEGTPHRFSSMSGDQARGDMLRNSYKRTKRTGRLIADVMEPLSSTVEAYANFCRQTGVSFHDVEVIEVANTINELRSLVSAMDVIKRHCEELRAEVRKACNKRPQSAQQVLTT